MRAELRPGLFPEQHAQYKSAQKDPDVRNQISRVEVCLSGGALVPPPIAVIRAMNLLQLFRQVWRHRQPVPTAAADDRRDRSSMADLVRALDRADREDLQRNGAR